VSVELVAAWAHRAGWRGRSRWSRAHVGAGGVRTAVLMPAHNEEATIGGVLDALVPLLGERDRVLVVADNCTDATATIARAHGAEVIERESERERGKGYALEFGRAH